ncbi:MAG: hypothetical protein ACJA09_000795 [Alcanivorax sp.]|jgi:hypothetical protein
MTAVTIKDIPDSRIYHLMIKRTLIFTSIMLLLTGCLRVEMVGPITGGQITIRQLGTDTVIVSNLSTSDVESASAQFAAFWDDWDDFTQMLLLGNAPLPDVDIDEGAYYLITVSGGVDVDANGDHHIDITGQPVTRDLHAIASGMDLQRSVLHVNLLTESIYQILQFALDDMSSEELSAELDDLAVRAMGETQHGNTPTYGDVLAYSRGAELPAYKGPEIFMERMSRALRSPFYDDETLYYDAQQLIYAASWRPAREDGPFADRIIGCIGAVEIDDLCTFAQLPLLGQAPGIPSIEDIMDRVIVSHPWMSQRFEQALKLMPDDIRLLFRSAAAVVIDSEIRPSNYRPSMASMFLDPQYLWLYPSEFSTISTDPDFRSEFALRVSFADFNRYVDPIERRFGAIAFPDENGNRDIVPVAESTARILFHELGHAADFFPPSKLDSLSPVDIPLTAIQIPISDILSQISPIVSPELFGIASVLFQGVQPSQGQSSYSAAQIGQFFESDRASALYAYSSQYEDLAMLFEESMMAIHYDLRRDMAFTTVPPEGTSNIDCADYVVEWGVRGRLTVPQVLSRAKFIITKLLPEREYEGLLDNLPGTELLDNGKDWCDSVILDSEDRLPLPNSVEPRKFNLQPDRAFFRQRLTESHNRPAAARIR